MKSLLPSRLASAAAGPDVPSRFSQLLSPLQALVRLCQTVNFGGIHRVRVENGHPRWAMNLHTVIPDHERGPDGTVAEKPLHAALLLVPPIGETMSYLASLTMSAAGRR
jgi:hypothetical protein